MKYFTKPTSNESIFGLIYFLLQLLVIPGIVIGVDYMLPEPMSEALLNFICFAINFVAVLIIFRKFLLDNLAPVKEAPWYVLRCAGIGFLIYMAGNIVFSFLVTMIDPDFALCKWWKVISVL